MRITTKGRGPARRTRRAPRGGGGRGGPGMARWEPGSLSRARRAMRGERSLSVTRKPASARAAAKLPVPPPMSRGERASGGGGGRAVGPEDLDEHVAVGGAAALVGPVAGVREVEAGEEEEGGLAELAAGAV